MLFLVLGTLIPDISSAQFTNSCSYEPCRWNVMRTPEDASQVRVEDESMLNMSWKWDARGGHWIVMYYYKYPSEWYQGKATFVNCSVAATGENAFVSWGSNTPWKSNAVPVYGTPWKINFNGDTFGFVPTQDGRYIFRIFTKNKRHDPFGANEALRLPSDRCSFTSDDTTAIRNWFQDQSSNSDCNLRTLFWILPGKFGKWTVKYQLSNNRNKIDCDVHYQTQNVSQTDVIHWELDKIKQTASYAANPIRIYENSWKFDFIAEDVWGFTSLGKGLWIFQHFTRDLIFQPPQNVAGRFSPNTL